LVIRIQHLQWLGGVVAAAACLALGVLSLHANFSDHMRYRRAGEQLQRFHASLIAATSVSAERGPANSAMGGREEDRATLAAALAARRALTDRDITVAEAQIGRDQRSQAIAQIARQLREDLAAGRAAVDAVIARPAAYRGGAPTRQAIEAMFTAADTAGRLREALGHDAVLEASELASDVIINTVAGALREETGRLGSFVVMKLTSDEAVHPRLDAAIATTRARIDMLRAALRNYAAAFLPGTGIEQAVAIVEDTYFRGALPFVERIAALRADEPRPDADTFTRLYVPGMKPVEELRDKVAAASRVTIEKLSHQSFLMVLASLLLTTVAVLAILAIALVFRDGLFRPLMTAHRQVLRIANGDLSDPPRQPSASAEVRAMFEGLEMLRLQQRRRLELEEEQMRLSERLRHLSRTDMLTGLLNRRALQEAADHAFATSDAGGGPMAVILFDIDHFKAINDGHGHGVGDDVLRAIAETLGAHLGPDVAFGRHGGEEFIVLLPGDEAQATARAEALRRTLERVVVATAPGLTVTGSFGVAVRLPGSGLPLEDLVAVADRRLYLAKIAGRNRVCSSDPLGPLPRRAVGN
jgi:diguanylate cyclase (GGDEF)-like protein